MTSFHPSILVSLISKTVPTRVFEEKPVDPLSEFARRNLNSIEEELRGLSLPELEACAERFENLRQDLDDEVANALNELVLEELNIRDDKHIESPVPSAAQRELSQFLSLEQELKKWVEDPEVSGEKEEAAERIRKAFLEDSSSLDLSGLGLNNLPESLLGFQNLREVKLFKNAFSGAVLTELKDVLREHGIRLVYQEHYTGKDSPLNPVKASSLRHVDPQTYKSLEARRQEKVGQMWDCLECKPDSYGGFRYKFSLKPEYLDPQKYAKKLNEIFPAAEPDIRMLKRVLGDAFPHESDALDLGFECGGEGGDFFVWMPDVEALTARYSALREAQPGRGLTPHLDIVRSDGIASDLDFVEALMAHNALVSDSVEFVHDMTAHILLLLKDLLEPKAREKNMDLYSEWQAIREVCWEFSLPDLDLSNRESVLAAANALKAIQDEHGNVLDEMKLSDQVKGSIWRLSRRAKSLEPYEQARYPFAGGIARSWGKLLVLKEKLAGGIKDVPLENQAAVKELIEIIETSLGALTDIGSVRSTRLTSLSRQSFSFLWDDSPWTDYANRRYGEKNEAAYKQLVTDLENAWDAVEDFFQQWKLFPALRHFVEHDLKNWENDPEVQGNKSEAVTRILASLEKSEDGLRPPKLDLSNLGLSQLPEGFQLLMHLTSLNLSGNQFDRIPDAVKTLPLLEDLDLSKNQINSPDVGVDIISSKHLQHFDISNNNYNEIDNLVISSNKTRTLNLSGNKAKGAFPWPNFVQNSAHLEVLELSGNEFSAIAPGPYGYLAPSSLKEVWLGGSPLDDLLFDKDQLSLWARKNDIQVKFD